MADREINASQLLVGDTYEEDGMDPVTITRLEHHGDRVLVWGERHESGQRYDLEMSLDRDVVVLLNRRNPNGPTKSAHVTLEATGAWEVWSFVVPADADENYVRENYSRLSGNLEESGNDHTTISEIEFEEDS